MKKPFVKNYSAKPNLGRIRTVDRNSCQIDEERKVRRSRMESQFRIEEVNDLDGELTTAIVIRKDALRVIGYAIIQGSMDERCPNPGMCKAIGSQLLTIASFHDGPEIDPSRVLVDKNGVGIVDEVIMADGRIYSFETGEYYTKNEEFPNQAHDEAAEVDEDNDQ